MDRLKRIEGSPLRVLMVTPRYFPYMGGIETHVHEVGRRLAGSGCAVTLLTTIPFQVAIPLREEVEGMRVLRVPAWPPQKDYYIAPQIYSIIQQGSWDLVHCQGCHTFVPPLAMLAARKAGIPYVVTFHTGGHSSLLRANIRGMQWRALRPLLAGAVKLIGVSTFEASYFRETLNLPAEKFTVISNGATMPSVPTRVGSSEGQTLVISIGRLERYKGHHRLISALPRLQERYPDIRLLILGHGPYEETLRTQAEQLGVAHLVEIRAVPPGNREEMARILAQAKLVALLSEYEAHPIGVLEALALKRPVLVADTSGLHELAEQGLVRAISLASSPDEIASAAIQQIEAPLVAPASLALPTWDECVHQLQAVYSVSVRSELCAF